MKYKVIGRLGQCYISDSYMDLQTLKEEDLIVPRSVITEDEEMYIDIDKDFINIDALDITKEEYTDLLCSSLDISFELKGLLHVMDMKLDSDDALLIEVFSRYVTTGELAIERLPITLYELKYELAKMPKTDSKDDRLQTAILFIKFAKSQDAVISACVLTLMGISTPSILTFMLRDISPVIEQLITAYINDNNRMKSYNSSIYNLPDAIKVNSTTVLYYLLIGVNIDIYNFAMVIDNQQNVSIMSNWIFDTEMNDVTFNEIFLKGETVFSLDLAAKNMIDVKMEREEEITQLTKSYKPEEIRFKRNQLVGAIHNACLNLLHNYTKNSLFWDYIERLYRQVTIPKPNISVLSLYKEFMSESDNPIEKEYMRLLVRQRYTRESIWYLIFKDMDIEVEGKFLIFTETFLSKAEDIPLFIKRLEMVPAGRLGYFKIKILRFLEMIDG